MGRISRVWWSATESPPTESTLGFPTFPPATMIITRDEEWWGFGGNDWWNCSFRSLNQRIPTDTFAFQDHSHPRLPKLHWRIKVGDLLRRYRFLFQLWTFEIGLVMNRSIGNEWSSHANTSTLVYCITILSYANDGENWQLATIDHTTKHSCMPA